MGLNNTLTTTTTTTGIKSQDYEQHDINLLQILSSKTTHVYPTDIAWNLISHPKTNNAQSRWIELISHETHNMQQLPIYQLAKYILEKKMNKADAAVEAMQLPSTKDLLDRIEKVTNAVNALNGSNSVANAVNALNGNNSVSNAMNA